MVEERRRQADSEVIKDAAPEEDWWLEAWMGSSLD
jgi:hypothetical protein